ncbi:hypothetical protein HELRODRAFT_158446 [Helobdella robusta]|uniref:THAP-type domain-containing protein n=1 Tax=Helobdella robusta TaxID=6412 RepID=T1EMS9_HELRO|nr:hypothetical protein HELRODRAFT_158446 [Helobdella robusta]ESO12038.1 hypothetical protein HELRODRAFT_158446 [Helobdella robusta]
MPMCSISKCHGSYKDIGVTLHRLPKDDSQRIQWEGNIKNHITNFCSRKNIFICSRHFLQECFYKEGSKMLLKKTSVPTVFPKILSNDQADTLSEMQSPIMIEKKSTDEPTGIDALTPRSLKRKAKKLDILLKTTRKVLYNYNKKIKRLKVKLEVYRNEIKMLKKYNDELTSTLLSYSVKLVAHILSNSVAKALRCSSNCEEFRDCRATVQFLEKMNILFDIMNRRSNDNPNVQQLHSIFKKVYYRCGIVPGKTGNVQEQMIVESEFKVPEDQFKDIFEETYLDSQIMTSNTMSTVIENPSNTMSTIIDSAVAYIAGWVVRKVAKTIDCNKCRFTLIDIKRQATMLHQQLLILKDNGVLVFPSCGVVQVRK